ncbi:MAG: lipoate--protein ligase family protein [bacterium]
MEIIIEEKRPGKYHMRRDLELFNAYEGGGNTSTLRIYSWEPKCISLGYSQNVGDELEEVRAQAQGWDIVKRPTGGGIVFHNEAEVTYSIITALDNPQLPKGLISSYKKISEAIVLALKDIGAQAEIHNSSFGIRHSALCFSYPAEYEIVAEGKKLVGSAQKRGKRTLLQQGSIFVRETPTEVYELLKEPTIGVKAISLEKMLGREITFDELKASLTRALTALF